MASRMVPLPEASTASRTTRRYRTAVSKKDAGGHRMMKAVRITDRDNQLTNPDGSRIAKLRRGKIRGGHPHDREIGVGVFADEGRRHAPPIRQRHVKGLGTMHNVAISKDEAVGGEDEAGAMPLLLTSAAAALHRHDRWANQLDRMHDRL